MKYILFRIDDYNFITNLDYVFKITAKKDVKFSDGKIFYKDYNFIDLSQEIQRIIGKLYEGEYVILFTDEAKQAGVVVQSTENVMEIEAKDLYPIPSDIFKDDKCLFRQYYYDNKNKRGALVFDFNLIK
jgi:hypothetical protein